MGISVLRSWEDTDAPVLLHGAGGLIPVLKAVLVDGYGDNPGLGWDLVWEQSSKIVFRNKGTRSFVQFTQEEAYYAYVRAYESMSDIDTGLMPCPLRSNEDIYFRILIGSTTTTNPGLALPWVIIGDDKGFWIGIRPGYSYYGATSEYAVLWKFSYIGDYIPYDPDNIYFNFAMCQDLAADDFTEGSWPVKASAFTSPHHHILRSPDNVEGSVTVGMSSGSSYCSSVLGDGNPICNAFSEIQFTSIPEIHRDNKIIGRLPGFKNSLSEAGHDGAHLYSYSDLIEKKPKLTFDYGDSIDHFFPVSRYHYSGYHDPVYLVFTEGKGFRPC